MALTSDSTNNELVGKNHTNHTDRAKSGTYYRGQFVQYDSSLQLLGPASGSTGNPGLVAGTVVCGIVDRQQVISSDGEALDYKRGWVATTATGATSPGQLLYLHSDTAFTNSVGSGRAVGGRFIGHVSGANAANIVDVGNVASGTLI